MEPIMATNVINQATPIVPPPGPAEAPAVSFLSSNSTTASVNLEAKAPFSAIRAFFDHLHTHPDDVAKLNATYPHRGVIKTAALHKTESDQKFTIDLSPMRSPRIPEALRESLDPHGLAEVLNFFNALSAQYVPSILSSLSVLAGTDLAAAHTSYNMNYRLCDYHPNTAAPDSLNGCGAHTDYGTFSIIFQDGTPGLELEETPSKWIPVPGDSTVVLTGWCAVILSGGRVSAAKHRVRRAPSVRRLSAVLFVAPDLDVKLKPLGDSQPIRPFSEIIMRGELDVETFKDVMGKRWRYREGNEEMDSADSLSQDNEIENMVWG
ncbi:unnamed protein product [Penicillium nalgiovense]|uniref:Fe2OG dioxygenase domain-containing protein n=2 Tax=Penicillium nalgiovense TaxID=60175 RepID=A0A9W4I406_PENNA|nr:unnamed protein product [Penicillium nalgiovense]CAG7941631.1 unnamed protein product [Penicillium nalgiovense]CAG7941946.1 unnamed protein product [Penicillium nalgiovense]CAG8183249.1 unnamed protein product [Penicillium nalgiovense]CAG8184462.1 unnamed protein product [Penicillium nalgiovense]